MLNQRIATGGGFKNARVARGVLKALSTAADRRDLLDIRKRLPFKQRFGTCDLFRPIAIRDLAASVSAAHRSFAAAVRLSFPTKSPMIVAAERLKAGNFVGGVQCRRLKPNRSRTITHPRSPAAGLTVFTAWKTFSIFTWLI